MKLKVAHRKTREIRLVKRMLGDRYSVSVHKYRARGVGRRYRRPKSEMLLDEELAQAVIEALAMELK